MAILHGKTTHSLDLWLGYERSRNYSSLPRDSKCFHFEAGNIHRRIISDGIQISVTIPGFYMNFDISSNRCDKLESAKCKISPYFCN